MRVIQCDKCKKMVSRPEDVFRILGFGESVRLEVELCESCIAPVEDFFRRELGVCFVEVPPLSYQKVEQ